VDYTSAISGIVIITTATLGFTQYFYTRATEKDKKLLKEIKKAEKLKKKDNPFFTMPEKSTTYDALLKQYNKHYENYNTAFKKRRKDIENYRHQIERDKNKKFVSSGIYYLAQLYIIFLVIQSSAIYMSVNNDVFSKLLKICIPNLLYIISALLIISIITISFKISVISKSRKALKINFEEKVTELEELNNEWNDFQSETEALIKNIKEQETTERKPTKEEKIKRNTKMMMWVSKEERQKIKNQRRKIFNSNNKDNS